MNVEKFSDDLWLGVKDQSNLKIAGSPRNSFRASLRSFPTGVELLFRWRGCKPTSPRQTPNTVGIILGVRLRGISFVVKRETAQIGS